MKEWYYPIFEPVLYQDSNSQLVFGHTEFMKRRDWPNIPANVRILYDGREIFDVVAIWRVKEIKKCNYER
jgi:hypothetical protein